MGRRELYSRREAARLREAVQDVYRYDNFPDSLRTQIALILVDTMDSWQRSCGIYSGEMWEEIHEAFIREKGVFKLSNMGSNAQNTCVDYIINCSDQELLDFVDFAFHRLECFGKVLAARHYSDPSHAATVAIEDLNHRLRQHGLGFEFVGGELVRIDSMLIHAEAVRPAIQLLCGAGPAFEGPLEEFMAAYKCFRESDHKNAILSASKAFESTLKAIFTERCWSYDTKKDTAKQLIDIALKRELLPSYIQEQFTTLRGVLESGVPTMRNRLAGHGQGPTPVPVLPHFVSYVLHLTASNIVFLIESHKALP